MSLGDDIWARVPGHCEPGVRSWSSRVNSGCVNRKRRFPEDQAAPEVLSYRLGTESLGEARARRHNLIQSGAYRG